MIDEQLEESASLYVFGLLNPEATRAFEIQLRGNPELERLTAELSEAAAALAHRAPMRTPPAHLRNKIWRELSSKSKIVTFPAWHRTVPWAIAACLALACILLATDRARLTHQVATLERRNAFSEMQVAVLTSKLSDAPHASAVVLWDPAKQEGVLKTASIPPSGAEHDYQLWVVDPQYKNPVNAGVFKVGRHGATKISFKPDDTIKSAKGFAISLERKGGVERKAEGPIVLITPE